MLEAAAKASGRTLSSEVEIRLRRSFDEDSALIERLGGRPIYAFLRLVASVMAPTGEVAYFLRHSKFGHQGIWLHDPVAFDHAVRAINSVLEALRPEGDAGSTTDRLRIEKAMANLPEHIAGEMVTDVGQADPTKSLSATKYSKRQALAHRVAQDLGPSHAIMKRKKGKRT